jgi:hypothetical protein
MPLVLLLAKGWNVCSYCDWFGRDWQIAASVVNKRNDFEWYLGRVEDVARRVANVIKPQDGV